MSYWLNLAAFHVERRDAAQAKAALCHALAEANRSKSKSRAGIMRAISYVRRIEKQS